MTELPFVVFDPASGRILRHGRIHCGEPQHRQRQLAAQILPGEAVIVGIGAAETHYVREGQVFERPILPAAIDRTRIRADGRETCQLLNLPSGTTATVRGRAAVIDDGVFEFTTTMPGRYEVALACWPHRDRVVTLEAVP